MSERIEVITRRERRRRWSVEQKLAIVAQTHRPGVTVGEVARRHDVAPNLVFTWRRMAQGRPARRGDSFQLVPVHLAEPGKAARSGRPPALAAGRIEIGLPGGIKVKIDANVTPERLASVLAVLGR